MVPVGSVLSLVVVSRRPTVLFLLFADRKAGGAVLIRDDTRHVNHAALDAARRSRCLGTVGRSRDAVRVEVDVGLEVSLGPLAGRGIGAEGDHTEGGGDDDNQGHNKGDAPGLAVGVPAALERVEDGRHDEVGDAAAGVAPPAGQCVGRAHDVLVEEARRPHHAWDKGAAQDADEESADVEAGGIMNQWGEAEGNRADEEETGKDPARSELIAKGSGNESDKQAVILHQQLLFNFRYIPEDLYTYVAHSDTMFELATWADDRPRFDLMVCDNCTYLSVTLTRRLQSIARISIPEAETCTMPRRPS